MKILKYYDDIFEAQTDREYLANEGIPAEVFNEHISLVLPISYANPSMRPYIGVPDECYDAAAALVPPDPVPVHVCPDCGSDDLACRLPKKLSGFSRIVMPLLMLAGNVGGGNLRKIYHCNQCGREFRI